MSTTQSTTEYMAKDICGSLTIRAYHRGADLHSPAGIVILSRNLLTKWEASSRPTYTAKALLALLNNKHRKSLWLKCKHGKVFLEYPGHAKNLCLTALFEDGTSAEAGVETITKIKNELQDFLEGLR